MNWLIIGNLVIAIMLMVIAVVGLIISSSDPDFAYDIEVISYIASVVGLFIFMQVFAWMRYLNIDRMFRELTVAAGRYLGNADMQYAGDRVRLWNAYAKARDWFFKKEIRRKGRA